MTETRIPQPGANAQFELMAADDDSRYLLRSATEILYVLRGLLKSRDLITAYFNEGRDFLLTALLAVDEQGMVLDYGADAGMNRAALAADKLILVATHEKVKIQFAVPGVKPVEHDGRRALAAPLPAKLLRLQRREYYRLVAPVAQPLKCILTLPPSEPESEPRKVEAQIVDISGGGIAVMTAAAGIEFLPDQEFESCQLELPDIGSIRAGLRVRNVFQITLRNGARVKRYGCQFVRLPGAMLSMVERYIMKVERERKARGAV